MTRNPPGYVPIDEVANQGKPYRLWRKPPITAGNPIIILVHGAVVPVPGAFHDPTTINNTRYCFYDLDDLLYQDFHYNVFTFEYADELIPDFGYIDYNDLEQYSECLVDAIEFAKEKSKKQDGTVGPVTIIAHSFGGLVARRAAKLAVGTINKIITLDTGHRGFALANYIDNILTAVGTSLPAGTECTKDVEVGSAFINNLNEGFNPDNPELVSLAATEEIPAGFFVSLPPILPTSIRVVELQSSNMGQVYPLPYHHASISQITDSEHCAYKVIKKSLGKDVDLCL